MALAQVLSLKIQLHHFTLRQPWLTFTPRRVPKFELALAWKGSSPNTNHPPDIIITTGRKAAAVGKHYRNLLKSINHACKLIQILNPKDNLNKYDLVLLPQHDDVLGANVVQFQGSIHPYNKQWFKQQESELSPYIGIVLGNPNRKYFELHFADEISLIRSSFPNTPLYFCGSPRLAQNSKEIISSLVENKDKIWLDETDGVNPYQPLLSSAKKLCVSSDSINMLSESCQSNVPVSVLAKQLTPSPKHQRFIQSIQHRLCALDCLDFGTPIEYALNQIKLSPLIHSLLKDSL